jgi:hypothetical protein
MEEFFRSYWFVIVPVALEAFWFLLVLALMIWVYPFRPPLEGDPEPTPGGATFVYTGPENRPPMDWLRKLEIANLIYHYPIILFFAAPFKRMPPFWCWAFITGPLYAAGLFLIWRWVQ